MDVDDQCKLTIVTPPDFHVAPNALRAVVIGGFKFRSQVQDEVGLKWPAQDITLYPCEGKPEAEMEWLLMQLSIADIAFVNAFSYWEWVWPMLATTNAKLFFKVEEDFINHQSMIKSLKLTSAGRVFNTIEDMVAKAASLHT